MTCITRWALALLTALLCSVSPAAQDAAVPPIQPEVTLQSLREQLEQVPTVIDNDDQVRKLTSITNEIVAQTERFAASRTTQLNDLNARLGELGPAPAAGTAEAPDVTRQRANLTRERNSLDADIRLARLLAVDAQQRRSEVLARRRAVFEAQLFERADSPLTSAFWEKSIKQWPTDQARIRALNEEIRVGWTTALKGFDRTSALLGLAGAVVMLCGGLWLAEFGLAWLAARFFPVGRLRRSLLALLTVLGYVLITGLALSIAWETLDYAGTWGTQSARMGNSAVRFGMFLAFVIGLGRALLSNRRPSWRLPPISNAMASRLAPVPWLFAFVVGVAWLPTQVNDVIDNALSTVLTNLIPTAVMAVAAILGLTLLRRPRPAAAPAGKDADADAAAEAPDAAERPGWVGLLIGLVITLLVALAMMVMAGYLAFSRVVAGQAVWAGIVIASAYLLFKFADDLWMALLSSRSNMGQRLQKGLGVTPQTLDQAAVVLSAISRVCVFFYMVIAFVAPLGSTPGDLLQRSGRLGTGLQVGEFQVVPAAIFSALGVLIVGFLVLRLFKRWLENSYLPNTKLETGMRSSLTTLLGYVGGILVIAFALSALGIGINRIAWVASALSVGIGFGLQAIVQNFISGLILLAERPVKVGDWVVLGTSEGDVRRINVRATEIQLGDRSTLIVPNSEFITKTVRNMTLANAEGRVLIRLPMPLTTDAQKVRDVMLEACREHETILPTPEAGVTLDGIENGLLIFQAIAYVPNPRLAGGVRSDLLFTILGRLQEANVPMAVYATPTTPAAPGQLAPPLAPPAPAPGPFNA
ncbi:DUF3772 domain-containing protein [Variovorax sp. J22R133]|uniref:DUF3772 domain-containing protein n=1 Tax=Variovorax brevis TaxID=3053503 RepID=UPI002575E029|nr:DUF3772 domain-containing protein [Variovorax sp. J22R133]MDM0112953.1 DUF3772 domain-containing protein [Variovorax sp. J22R133]